MNSPRVKALGLLTAIGLYFVINAIVSNPSAVAGEGDGLKAEYFSDIHLRNLKLTRVDSTINFDWRDKAAASSLPTNNFSVRWTGKITPLYSENYRFSTISDDGVRLWVNGQQIINNWSDHSVTEDSAYIYLTAGAQYDIKMEYYERWGSSVAKLMWSSDHQNREVVPQSQLSSNVKQTKPTSTVGTINMRNWNASTNNWKTTGDWYNCDGSIDNDPAHHTFDLNDRDPAHHLGMVCDGTKEAWQPNSNLIPVANHDTFSASNREVETITEIASAIPDKANSSNDSSPFANAKLYVNSHNDPSNYSKSRHGTYEGKLMEKIARQPEVTWLGGWNYNITGDVSNFMNAHSEQGALPIFVVYNIPNRDCGGYSSGGVSDANSYGNWISKIASTIGNRKAVVILEPDAITLTDCLNQHQKYERNQMLKDAVSTFKSKSIAVYIDAGHPNWHSAEEIAKRLKDAGVDSADGFALNIANFYTNEQNASFGKQVSEQIGGKHFVVDTGRNGSGASWDAAWCNPHGRSLGNPPTTNTGNSLIDAYLWIKGPGGSDGNCNGGPSAGTFWPDYALELAKRTNW